MNAPDMYPMEALRLPPHSVEAEQSVLAALLTDNAAWDRITDLIGPASFYRQDHRLVFEAIAQLIEANKPADVITVADALQAAGQLEDMGGLAMLGAITAAAPAPAAKPAAATTGEPRREGRGERGGRGAGAARARHRYGRLRPRTGRLQ